MILYTTTLFFQYHTNFSLYNSVCFIDIQINLVEKDVEWLQNNSEPKDEVIEKWKNTLTNRIYCKKVAQYFALYTCLNFSFGHLLLSSDFDKHYPDIRSKFIDTWDDVAENIIKYARTKQKLLQEDDELIDLGKSCIVAFHCIPRLLGTIVSTKRDQNGEFIATFGTTIKEVTQSFIVNVETEEELTEFQEKRDRLALLTGNKVIGPYVACVGDFSLEGGLDNDIYIYIYIYI
ncbi:uncharacterized protein LOC116416665 [Nasonia vitripennis]|uniref:Uncharacterized protein n=1 Tax=Nasonia vitripennis TaxID=7425 RepID=A0A7M7Q4A1_NASVI|nr:uncharacterized protein LOC116416665 [Nasonia vitripennis]